MTIKKMGNNNYTIRVTMTIGGKKKEKKLTSSFPTMGQAKIAEDGLIQQLIELKAKTENQSTLPLWENALNDYFQKAKDEYRVNTYYSRKAVLKAHTGKFMSVVLKDMNYDFWKKCFDEMEVSVSHKKEILKFVKQVLDLQLLRETINVNPAKFLKIHIDKNAKEKANSLSAMTQDEIRSLLNYLSEMGHEWYPIFYITYQLGLRSSEAQALEFSDIDWTKNQIVIQKSWCKYKNNFVPPKNGTSRIVPMNAELKMFLKNEFYFPSQRGFVLPRNKKWMGGRATEVLQEIQKHLGIKCTNYHSLRASFITHLLRSGKDIISVQAMVGHRELKTTQRYIRLDATDLIGATKSLELGIIF